MKQILCQDALVFLQKQPNNSIPNIITGIPDFNEMNYSTMEEYLSFFKKTANLLFEKVVPNGILIFIQTDRKYNKQWLDKSTLLNNTAHSHKFNLLWHKIILSRPVNSVYLQRPTYSHFLAYSKTCGPGNNIPDVIEGGKKIYENGTSINAAEIAVEFVKKNTKSNPYILDPFVGRGTITAMAEKVGINSIGIDIDPKQCEFAKKLKF